MADACTAGPGRSGTLKGYSVDKCRCSACRAENTRYRKVVRLRIDAGRPPTVPAGPIRARIAELLANGYEVLHLAEAAGVPETTLRSLTAGATDRCRLSTAEAIMSTPPTPRRTRSTGRLPSAGTRRRLQALAARGWSFSRLAERLGVTANVLWGWCRRPHVLATTAARVRALYDELWDAPPPAFTDADRALAARTAATAAARGWPPPLAWDDETIDDPAALPEGGSAPASSSSALPLEDLERLVADGATWTVLEARTRTRRSAIERRLYRHGRHDLVAKISAGSQIDRSTSRWAVS